MKPLTIKQLKALKVGDWVWRVYPNAIDFSTYIQKMENNGDYFYVSRYKEAECKLLYATYGTKWLAYKNKEQAEAKGEIVELPCLRDKPTLYYHGEPTLRKELNYMTKDGTIVSVPYSEDEFDEAEAKLAELKGEK